MSRFERRALREREYFVAKQQARIARDARVYTGFSSRADLRRPIANKPKRQAAIA
jgi:hypothetical protein